MQAAEISQQRPADHDVVKMCDDEIGVAEVHVRGQRRQKHSSHPTDREQADEAEPIEHRRVVRDRSFIKRRAPVKDFDC